MQLAEAVGKKIKDLAAFGYGHGTLVVKVIAYPVNGEPEEYIFDARDYPSPDMTTQQRIETVGRPDWTTNKPNADRFVSVSDGIVTVYATIPSAMLLDDATSDYAETAKYDIDTECRAELYEDGESVESETFVVLA